MRPSAGRACLPPAAAREAVRADAAAHANGHAAARRVRLGRDGADGVLQLGPLSAHERAGLTKMMPELKDSIAKGVAFANK